MGELEAGIKNIFQDATRMGTTSFMTAKPQVAQACASHTQIDTIPEKHTIWVRKRNIPSELKDGCFGEQNNFMFTAAL